MQLFARLLHQNTSCERLHIARLLKGFALDNKSFCLGLKTRLSPLIFFFNKEHKWQLGSSIQLTCSVLNTKAPKHFPDRLDSTGILIGSPEPTISLTLYSLNCTGLIPLHPLAFSHLPTPAFHKTAQ